MKISTWLIILVAGITLAMAFMPEVAAQPPADATVNYVIQVNISIPPKNTDAVFEGAETSSSIMPNQAMAHPESQRYISVNKVEAGANEKTLYTLVERL